MIWSIFLFTIFNLFSYGFTQNFVNPCIPDDTVQFYPHPADETKFIQCGTSGQMFMVNCPPGLIWISQSLKCGLKPTVPSKSHSRNRQRVNSVSDLMKSTIVQPVIQPAPQPVLQFQPVPVAPILQGPFTQTQDFTTGNTQFNDQPNNFNQNNAQLNTNDRITTTPSIKNKKVSKGSQVTFDQRPAPATSFDLVGGSRPNQQPNTQQNRMPVAPTQASTDGFCNTMEITGSRITLVNGVYTRIVLPQSENVQLPMYKRSGAAPGLIVALSSGWCLTMSFSLFSEDATIPSLIELNCQQKQCCLLVSNINENKDITDPSRAWFINALQDKGSRDAGLTFKCTNNQVGTPATMDRPILIGQNNNQQSNFGPTPTRITTSGRNTGIPTSLPGFKNDFQIPVDQQMPTGNGLPMPTDSDFTPIDSSLNTFDNGLPIETNPSNIDNTFVTGEFPQNGQMHPSLIPDGGLPSGTTINSGAATFPFANSINDGTFSPFSNQIQPDSAIPSNPSILTQGIPIPTASTTTSRTLQPANTKPKTGKRFLGNSLVIPGSSDSSVKNANSVPMEKSNLFVKNPLTGKSTNGLNAGFNQVRIDPSSSTPTVTQSSPSTFSFTSSTTKSQLMEFIFILINDCSMITCEKGFTCVTKIGCPTCNPSCNPDGNFRDENVVAITCANLNCPDDNQCALDKSDNLIKCVSMRPVH